jgi:hypothetical protein
VTLEFGRVGVAEAIIRLVDSSLVDIALDELICVAGRLLEILGIRNLDV